MAEILDDGEFWLPSEFLTDDDPLLVNDIIDITGHDGVSKFSTTFNHSGDSANSSKRTNCEQTINSQKLAISFLNGNTCWQAERGQSLGAFSKVPNASRSKQESWDLFDTCEDKTKPINNTSIGFGDHPRGCSHHESNGMYCSLQRVELMRQQLILKHFEALRSEGRRMKLQRMYSNQGILCDGGNYQQSRSLSLSKLNTVKKQRAGTGVFLPRRIEDSKTSELPNILLPARVVRALNLDVGEIPILQGSYYKGVELADATFRNSLPKIGGDVRLPQEWTY